VGGGYTTRKNVGNSALSLNCSEYDGVLETTSRYVKFNIDEIQNVACAAVGPQQCVAFKKLGELGMSHSVYLFHLKCSIGPYNKIFALYFDNGVEVVPTAFAGAPFFTTASEVATLVFAWEVLGIRVPRVSA
jgi:hypothetical protein